MAAAFPEDDEEERTCNVCTTAGNERLYARIMRAIFVDGSDILEEVLTDLEEAGYRKKFGKWTLLKTREELFWRPHPFPDIDHLNDPIIQERVWVAMQRLLRRTDKLKEIEQLPDQKAKVVAATAHYRGLLLHVAAARAEIVKAKWISRISGTRPHTTRDNCRRIPMEVAMLDPPNFKIRRAVEYRTYQQWPCYFAFQADTKKVNDPMLAARAAVKKRKLEEERLLWNEYVTSLGLGCYRVQDGEPLNRERALRIMELVQEQEQAQNQ